MALVRRLMTTGWLIRAKNNVAIEDVVALASSVALPNEIRDGHVIFLGVCSAYLSALSRATVRWEENCDQS